ncbi:2-oxoacid:ferredoxin oxidoreductase subunit beta [Candidatus Bathyarchaeota archaeon]|nr:2-oxoacid:ferredoxin oxidoreductase subunit beta [Candidatus Bathyarchaeota archaeon]
MTPKPEFYPNEQPEHPLTLKSMMGAKEGNFGSLFCAGCGYGIIGQLFTKVFDKEALDPLAYPLVLGIGCYTQMVTILHHGIQKIVALHGRAPAIATGLKLANPSLKPIVMTGDGDCLGIGTNHFVHLCRRNLDCLVILFNNGIYGMTGGQVAPTTPKGYKTGTTMGPAFENTIDGVQLALAAGASHVARITIAHPRTFMKYLKTGLKHEGTSVIEVITPCVTYFGKKNVDNGGNSLASGGAMLQWIRHSTTWRNQAALLDDDELAGKYVIGEFKLDGGKLEYSEQYDQIRKRAMKSGDDGTV